ncbi:MAG: N-acetylmuramoyl-L-alanine amidase [Clostridiales bacterium]|nr:N-acetylmuramoyl-L-alanine amidase [Clostridiales bacterium]
MAISIVKKTGTANTSASAGRSIQYIVIHYTAGVSSKSGTAADTAAWFASSSAKASADFIVDDATIVQYNPDPANRYCWAVGGKKQNSRGGSLYGTAKNANCVSIEICSANSTGTVKEANDATWSLSGAAVAKAAELTKYLMETYGISKDHVIRHYDVNGKLCPGVVGWNAESGSEAKWISFKNQLSGTGTTAQDTSAGTGGSLSGAAVKTAAESAQSREETLRGTYTVTANSGLKVRNGAGTGANSYGKDKSVLVIIPYGTKVQCYGYYTAVNGTKWLYIQFTYNNVTYTGFASSAYLSKIR